jgi:hypothetical protein
MCLYSLPDKEVKIARRPIKCYKAIVEEGNSWVPIIRRGNKFKYNKILQALGKDRTILQNLTIECRDEPWSGKYIKVEEGFHAFTREDFAIETSERLGGVTKIAVIPRGSEYLEGINGDIVASKMIVFSSPLRYLLWRLFR